MKTKHYLITGGAGFIGSNIAKRLIKKGHKVSILDNYQRGKAIRLNNIKDKIKILKSDIRNQKNVDKAFKKIDCVIHLAYINGTKFFYQKPEEVLDIAVRGMLNVIDASKKNNVKEFILFSSSEVYDEPDEVPTPETVSLKIADIKNPRCSYGGGKICSELMLRFFCDKNFKRSITIRPHNVYGPDMGNEHVIPEMTKKVLKLNKNDKLKMQGSGKQTRSFIFIEDFLDAFELILSKGKHREIYNIGTKEEVKIIDLVKKILNYLNKKNKIIEGKIRKGSPTTRIPENKKIKKLGFRQKIKLKNGLIKTINWYKKPQIYN